MVNRSGSTKRRLNEPTCLDSDPANIQREQKWLKIVLPVTLHCFPFDSLESCINHRR